MLLRMISISSPFTKMTYKEEEWLPDDLLMCSVDDMMHLRFLFGKVYDKVTFFLIIFLLYHYF